MVLEFFISLLIEHISFKVKESIISISDKLINLLYFQIRVKMLVSRNPYWMPFSLQAMIFIILFMLTMSALFSGLNLSFTSVAISELNIITRMGDAYVCFLELPETYHTLLVDRFIKQNS